MSSALAEPGDAMDQPAAHASNKNSDEETAALAAVKQHHSGMLKRLNALTVTLTHAVKAGDTVAEHDSHAVLVEWCETELLPHALGEEGRLYSVSRNLPQGKLLVEGLLAEHQVMVSLVEELRGSAGVDAAVAAGSIRNIFALHLEKENTLLVPLIVASPELSLVAAVEGLDELVGETHVRRHGAGQGDSL
ncbi:MAG: hemerythrin domain-containing protein [Arthrobacter sp.]